MKLMYHVLDVLVKTEMDLPEENRKRETPVITSVSSL